MRAWGSPRRLYAEDCVQFSERIWRRRFSHWKSSLWAKQTELDNQRLLVLELGSLGGRPASHEGRRRSLTKLGFHRSTIAQFPEDRAFEASAGS